jgi:hypothetical protein
MPARAGIRTGLTLLMLDRARGHRLGVPPTSHTSSVVKHPAAFGRLCACAARKACAARPILTLQSLDLQHQRRRAVKAANRLTKPSLTFDSRAIVARGTNLLRIRFIV